MTTVVEAKRIPRDTSGYRAVQRAFILGGPGLLVLVLIALLCAGWFPAPSPDQSATQVSAYYAEHANGIRACSILLALGAILYAPFTALISAVMRRGEGAFSPLSDLQFGMGLLVAAFFTVPTFAWQAAAFRPDRTSAEITQAFHDFGWIMLFVAIFPGVLQIIALGAAILADRSTDPAFPRWFGFFNLWLAVLFLPATLLIFYKTGPFAWNGAFVFWIGFLAFGSWITLIVPMLRRAMADP